MSDTTTTDEDLVAIKSILIQWREEGTANPLLPMDVDLDGDGIVDSFGLDAQDNVVIVSGSTLAQTVYQSKGDDRSNHG